MTVLVHLLKRNIQGKLVPYCGKGKFRSVIVTECTCKSCLNYLILEASKVYDSLISKDT